VEGLTEIILSNLEVIAVAILALILIFYAIVTRQWGVLQVAALKLMLSAERLMATESGKAKMEAVFAAVWARVPSVLKLFITEKSLREKLQEWFNLAKDYLDDGTINKSTAP
jgi:hypothetical protein